MSAFGKAASTMRATQG